jgi:hypothetical protein
MVYPSTKYSENLLTEIDAEIATDRTNFWQGITKLQNKYENQYVNSNASISK